MKECLIDGCEREAKYKYKDGMICKKHYGRLRNGTQIDRPDNYKNTTCEADGCENKATRKGLCSKHYERLLTHGDPNYVSKIRKPGEIVECSVDGCTLNVKAKGLCNTHYRRFLVNGDPLIKRPNSVKKKKRSACLQCGGEIPIDFGLTNLCSYRCESRWKNKQADVRECIVCGKSFEWSHSAKVCSDECKEKHKSSQRKKWNEEQRATNPEYQRLRAAAQRRRRALKMKTQVENFNDKDIYERDGWVCGICGKKIDKRLKYPNKMSVSIDHIIPLSIGGTHEARNVQAAHLDCNRRKGNRATNEQLRMV